MKISLTIISALLIVTHSCSKKTAVNSTSQSTNSSSEASTKKEDFELLNAAYENWTSGAAGGNSGTDYYFKIKVKSSEQLNFDSTWVDKIRYPTYITKERKTISNDPVTFSTGDTITIRISDIKQNSKGINAAPPVTFDGAALIGYKANGRQKYYTVKKLEKKTSINRQ